MQGRIILVIAALLIAALEALARGPVAPPPELKPPVIPPPRLIPIPKPPPSDPR